MLFPPLKNSYDTSFLVDYRNNLTHLFFKKSHLNLILIFCLTQIMDVFSFGVLLFELISGEKAIDEEGKVLWAKVEGILEGNEGRKVKRVKEWNGRMRFFCRIQSRWRVWWEQWELPLRVCIKILRKGQVWLILCMLWARVMTRFLTFQMTHHHPLRFWQDESEPYDGSNLLGVNNKTLSQLFFYV